MPTAARGVFHAGLPSAERYAELLAGPALDRGLIGPREVPRLWERHLLNCAVVAEVLPAGARVGDVGSGAGLPGLVLAIVRPDLELCLIEPLLRRSTFLAEAISALGLANARVLRSRAEKVTETFDVVTARAVAPLERLTRWCLPLVRPGGELVAMKGRSAESELVAAAEVIGDLGGESARVEDVGIGVVSPAVRIVRIERSRG